MKILIIHNKYQEKGGEDNSFAIESQMLMDHGHEVETVVFDNAEISNTHSKIKLSYQLFYNNESARVIQHHINTFSPDIIHVHNFFYLASPSVFFVAKRNRIPVVFTVRNYRLICSGAYLLRNNVVCELCINKKFPMHGVIHKCHRNSFWQSAHLTAMTGLHKLLNTWNKKIDRFIVLTEFAKKKLLESSLELTESQIVVKPNFNEDHGYTEWDKRDNFYLFIGRLSEEKGIDVLLNAYRHRPFELKIIGTGPLANMVKDIADKHSDVEYLGFRDNAFIIDLLKKSKALLFPSKWYEGMPRTILEAFSTGTPVISTDLDNINEIVKNEINGISFENGNPISLVEKIHEFEKHPTKEALYRKARETFISKYTYDTNYKQLISIYEDLLKKTL
jgi:glycosyltransferase involved in cell wall biosynthesis